MFRSEKERGVKQTTGVLGGGLLQPREAVHNGRLLDKRCSGTPHLHPPAIRPGGQGVPESHVGAARDLWGS